jgi:conjugal transfer mating pair stabilization protein TraN
MVAVQTMGNVSGEFDADTLTLFDGEQAGCHKPVFGLVNCCAGKTSGLLTTAAGAAAIASGPAAIAALATPFLATFLCDSEEMMLDVKDRMGLCHYVGSYCSDKVLGVCTSKRKSYCCFESKLSRVLQEQGRTQLGMDWGKAKEWHRVFRHLE